MRKNLSDKIFIILLVVMVIGTVLYMLFTGVQVSNTFYIGSFWDHFTLWGFLKENYQGLVFLLVAVVVGYIAHKNANKNGFPLLLDKNVNNIQRFVIPFVIGTLLAAIPITIVYFWGDEGHISSVFEFISLPVVALIFLGNLIFAKITFELITMVLFLWVFTGVLFKKRWEKYLFWIGAIAVSLWAPLQTIYNMLDTVGGKEALLTFPFISALVILFFQRMISLGLFRKYGFLAALMIGLPSVLYKFVILLF